MYKQLDATAISQAPSQGPALSVGRGMYQVRIKGIHSLMPSTQYRSCSSFVTILALLLKVSAYPETARMSSVLFKKNRRSGINPGVQRALRVTRECST